MHLCPLWGGQHFPQECSRGMAIKAWCWGCKSVRNRAVVSFIADCCLSFQRCLAPPSLVPLELAHIPHCLCLLSHPSLCYFSSLPWHFWDRSWVLSSAGCAGLCWWLLGTVLWEFGAVPMACRSLPGSVMAVPCVGALPWEQGRIL